LKWVDAKMASLERQKFKIVTIEEIRDAAVSVFKLHPEMVFGYLYGSYATHHHDEFSDIDIAIVENRSNSHYHADILDTGIKIENRLNRDVNVDVRVLNDCTPRFTYQVIKNGVLLYCTDEIRKEEFEISAIRMYLDIKPMLDAFDKKSVLEVVGNED
jgi:predicted nucleotidyltransferase